MASPVRVLPDAVGLWVGAGAVPLGHPLVVRVQLGAVQLGGQPAEGGVNARVQPGLLQGGAEGLAGGPPGPAPAIWLSSTSYHTPYRGLRPCSSRSACGPRFGPWRRLWRSCRDRPPRASRRPLPCGRSGQTGRRPGLCSPSRTPAAGWQTSPRLVWRAEKSTAPLCSEMSTPCVCIQSLLNKSAGFPLCTTVAALAAEGAGGADFFHPLDGRAKLL